MFTLEALSRLFQQAIIQSVIQFLLYLNAMNILLVWLDNHEKRKRLTKFCRNISLGIPHQKSRLFLELNSAVYTSHDLDK